MARKVGNYPEEYYTKQVIKDSNVWTQDEFKKEYIYLSKRVNRALNNIERKYPRADTLTEQERMPRYSTLLKNGELDISKASSIMSEGHKFLTHEISTIKGFEKVLKNSINSFNDLFKYLDKEKGIYVTPEIFNKENVWDLFDFLKDYRHKYDVQEIPDSDQVVDAYYSAVQRGMSMENLLKNIDNYKKQVNMYGEIREEIPNGTSSDAYESLK